MKVKGKKRFYGLCGAARGWLIARLLEEHPRIVVIARDRKSADELVDDLHFFAGRTPVISLPTWDTLPFEQVSPQIDISAERIAALQNLTLERYVAVLTADTVMQRFLPPEIINTLTFAVSSGKRVDRETLIYNLDLAGYLRVPLVESIGEYTVRGGVIDIFPATGAHPIRLEFLDDLIEQIRFFDIESQRSTDIIASALLYPVREVVRMGPKSPFHHLLQGAIQRLKTRGKALETPPREIAKTINAFRTDADLPGLELAQFVALPEVATVFDYIPKDAQLIIHDEIGVHQMLDDFGATIEDREARLAAEHYLIPERSTMFLAPDEVLARISSHNPVYIDSLELFSEVPDSQRENIRSHLGL